ncbi:MAG: RcnB family protein [Telluria sp.]
MNTKSVISGLMAVCMIASAPAFAQRYDQGNNRGDQTQRGNDSVRSQDRGDRNDRHDRHDRADRNDRNDRNDRSDRYDRNDRHGNNERYGRSNYGHSNNAHYGARYDGPRHHFYRGGRLPSQYRGSHYVVNDWRGRHLSAPPRGYHWVQANNDYVLAAIATGIIAQVLLNN